MDLNPYEYKMIVESSPNMIWRSGLDTKCNYFNKRWLDFTGRTFEQEYGNGWVEGVHPDDLDKCIKTYLDNFVQRTPFEMEYRLLRHDGKWRWINDRGTPFFNSEGIFEGYIGSCMDITERIEGNMLKEKAQKDDLTGIYNRQHLLSLFEYEYESANRTSSILSIALLDIDRLKIINDTYGHLCGDTALKIFTGAVKGIIRQNDIFGRYGGDEFVIIFPDTPVEQAADLIDKIKTLLKSKVLKVGNEELEISFSVGFCEITDESSPAKMLDIADKNMYKDKKRTGSK